MMMGNRRDKFSPVRVGEELDVKIEAVGEKGDGIARKNGFVLFVPNTKTGDEVKIRVTKVLRKVGFAEVVGKGTEKKEVAESTEPEEEKAEDSENFGDETTDEGSDFDETPEDPEEEPQEEEEE